MRTDKIIALRWVNIILPALAETRRTNITICGQSAGGGSIANLISAATTFDDNLFPTAIIQSVKSNTETAASIVDAALPYIQTLCPNVTGVVRLSCLQALPADTLES